MIESFENCILRLLPNGVADGAKRATTDLIISLVDGRPMISLPGGESFLIMGDAVLPYRDEEDTNKTETEETTSPGFTLSHEEDSNQNGIGSSSSSSDSVSSSDDNDDDDDDRDRDDNDDDDDDRDDDEDHDDDEEDDEER